MVEQIKIGARVKPVLESDGLQFRDLNGNGVLDPYEDWRLTPAARAADLVARMSPEEKIGLMVINSRSMGISQPDKTLTSHDGVLDEQYHQIKNDPHNSSGLPYEGTTQQITELHMRHFIMRETPRGSAIATWVNTCRETAPTLVHCQAGLNRSSLVAARALVLGGRTPDEAITLIRRKRSPACLCNPAFERWLRAS